MTGASLFTQAHLVFILCALCLYPLQCLFLSSQEILTQIALIFSLLEEKSRPSTDAISYDPFSAVNHAVTVLSHK